MVMLFVSVITLHIANLSQLKDKFCISCFHFSVKEVEHLDWSARMRIIMGMAYCLKYMHHDLKPPVSHTNLNSLYILLTDDFAAKV